MITKAQAIASLREGAEWVLRGDDLEWLDANQTQPSDAEIEAEVARLTALKPARIATENRRAAYMAESDPLFFKAQRGEATMDEWQAKVAEIKTRFPKD
jgi:predicted P-loop ATPase